jgi:hypothetical protein
MELDPIALIAVLMATGFTMAYAGTRKNVLELRNRRRLCPSCGREISGRVCRAH